MERGLGVRTASLTLLMLYQLLPKSLICSEHFFLAKNGLQLAFLGDPSQHFLASLVNYFYYDSITYQALDRIYVSRNLWEPRATLYSINGLFSNLVYLRILARQNLIFMLIYTMRMVVFLFRDVLRRRLKKGPFSEG